MHIFAFIKPSLWNLWRTITFAWAISTKMKMAFYYVVAAVCVQSTMNERNLRFLWDASRPLESQPDPVYDEWCNSFIICLHSYFPYPPSAVIWSSNCNWIVNLFELHENGLQKFVFLSAQSIAFFGCGNIYGKIKTPPMVKLHREIYLRSSFQLTFGIKVNNWSECDHIELISFSPHRELESYSALKKKLSRRRDSRGILLPRCKNYS